MATPTDDDEIAELIATLCARAGMILEDAVLPAVTMPRRWNDRARVTLDALGTQVDRAGQLLRAAQALASDI